MAEIDDDLAIKIEGVSKDFRLLHEKADSVKSLFVRPFKKKGGTDVHHALKNINLEIKKGEFFGIVGRNGSGKSTLLKIIAGIYQPTKGRVTVNGRLVPFIELGVGFNPELTGRENVYLNGALFGFSTKQVDKMYRDIVEFAELEKFMDQKLKNYSSGMQVRLAFSMAIRSEADILLIDEVLAVGDADFQRKCYNYFKSLKKNEKAVVFVSHDMNAVREFCDRAALIENSEVVEIGSSSRVSTSYTRMFMTESDDNDNYIVQKDSGKRWGNQSVKIENVTLSPKNINSRIKEIRLDTVIKAVRHTEDVVMGLVVKNSGGEEVCGTNTRIKKNDLGTMGAGDSKRVSWTIPNIFVDGSYTIDLALHKSDGVTIFDWWEEATGFAVKRETKLSYKTEPNIELRAY